MKPDTALITVCPDRENLHYTVFSTKKGKEMEYLQWLVELAKTSGVEMPKTIIFCNTYNEIAAVLAYLLRVLGDSAYITGQPKCSLNRIIGIYHSMTWEKYKDRVVGSFKNNSGNVRIVLATSALGMGVNFPDVRYVIHLGPARSVIDHVQQAGRAGRDGKAAHNIIISTGSKLAHCESAIKDFVRAEGCLRKALLQTLDLSVSSVQPLHACCSNCSAHCKCNGDNCNREKLPFEKGDCKQRDTNNTRLLCDDDKLVLRQALEEYQDSLNKCTIPLFGSPVAVHGFSDQLIDDVINNAGTIFTVDDLLLKTPMFCTKHAKFILDIFQEIFQDMSETDAIIEELFDIDMDFSLQTGIEDHFDCSDSDEEDLDVFPTDI